MADYYTNISFTFPCTPYEAERLDAVFALDGEIVTDQPLGEPLDKIWPTLADLARDLTGGPHDDIITIGVEEYDSDDAGYSISSTGPNLEALARIIQACCQETLSERPIGFEWANDCSKARADAFGGGCCAIFKDRVEFASTHTILETMLNG